METQGTHTHTTLSLDISCGVCRSYGALPEIEQGANLEHWSTGRVYRIHQNPQKSGLLWQLRDAQGFCEFVLVICLMLEMNIFFFSFFFVLTIMLIGCLWGWTPACLSRFVVFGTKGPALCSRAKCWTSEWLANYALKRSQNWRLKQIPKLEVLTKSSWCSYGEIMWDLFIGHRFDTCLGHDFQISWHVLLIVLKRWAGLEISDIVSKCFK